MRIGWIGNSFVYFNDLPAMVASLLAAAGISTEHGQVTPGGQRFAGHAADPKVAALLKAQPAWDVVVLQDNSGVPGGADPAALAESHRALKESLVPMLPPRATVCVYGTWGHIHGSVYESQRSAYPDYPTMQRLTTEGCEGYAEVLASDASDASVVSVVFAPVGQAFWEVYQAELAASRDPLASGSLFARLFQPDAFHPSRLGSYLAACVFARVLLKERAGDRLAFPAAWRPAAECSLDAKLRTKFGGEWEPEGMSEEDAAQLQDAALRAVEGHERKRSSKDASRRE